MNLESIVVYGAYWLKAYSRCDDLNLPIKNVTPEAGASRWLTPMKQNTPTSIVISVDAKLQDRIIKHEFNLKNKCCRKINNYN